jgi:radical SAM protein with 4Fe4S-binding SPASM domain
MDDFFTENFKIQVLDFATDKRSVWEKKHQLYSVIFEITPKCNFNCVHCYLHDHHCSEELSHNDIIRIIDILYEKEVLFLTLTGGEIFTRKDFLDIYLYAKKKGFIIELYTNGALLNDEIISVFKKYPPLLVDISLYGSCEETYKKVTGLSGAFDKVMSNIRSLITAGIRVSVKAPVLNLYYSELPKIKAIAETFGIPFRTGFEIFPTIDNDDSVQQYSVSLADSLSYEFKEFERHPRTFGDDTDAEIVNLLVDKPLFRCKLGRASCAIDFDGKMCPCMSFRHVGQKLTMGNFDELWGSFQQYPQMKASETYKCLSCEAYDFCDICPAMMQSVHGDLEYIDEHFCKSAKARYAHYIKGMTIDEVIEKLI